MNQTRVIGALLFTVLSVATTFARAQPLATPTDDLSRAVVLVAKPELSDPIYGQTVLVVTPLNGNRHVGFIVNRPTEATLGNLFPTTDAAQKVVDPVYLGGPMGTQVLFALVQRSDGPSKTSVELMPGLHAAVDVTTVDSIIRFESDHARFVTGFVAWRPGELRDEIALGAWYVLEANSALALRKPDGLWEELVQSAQRAEKAIKPHCLPLIARAVTL